MQRFTTVSKSTATQTHHLVSSQPRLQVINLVPVCKYILFRYSCATRKHSHTSVSIHQRLQPFHSNLPRQTMSSTISTFYDLKADLPGGKTYDFEQLKGKVVLVVNVASKWYVQPLSRNYNEADLYMLTMGLQRVYPAVQR